MKPKFLAVFAISIVFFAADVPMQAKPNEYDLIVDHLKTKYGAKKINIPFMWLARFAVSVSRPAGVKSFSITLFKDLKFSYSELDRDMQVTMRRAFGPEWASVLRVRTHSGQQAYMYMREEGKRVRIALVTIDKDQAAIIRATFSPERLADFVNDPKILGISLRDDPPPSEPHTSLESTPPH